ncbi:hypothetical protein NQ314_004649 [Rhamnusium bicolor]|uniref:Uncharacterized protein n=1 Tax=Rhamnusium bicolor TaxID=1586634 RepID=A0AAV8ZIX5_9CUCU|nr:hypothetical protein NQ314_004649 [Rhamnusium bicolor]
MGRRKITLPSEDQTFFGPNFIHACLYTATLLNVKSSFMTNLLPFNFLLLLKTFCLCQLRQNLIITHLSEPSLLF